MSSCPDTLGDLDRLLELTSPLPSPSLRAADCSDLEMIEAGQRARRNFAAFALRMISGFILYKDSKIKSQRRVAQVCFKWIFTRGKKHALSFDAVFEDVLDLSPAVMREQIRTISRDTFLHDIRACVENEEKAAERAADGPEDGDGDDDP